MPDLNVQHQRGASGSSMPAGSDGAVEKCDRNLARHATGDYICLKSLGVIVTGYL